MIQSGKIRSDVVDTGCGYAELSLALAAQGHTVVGIDPTPTAIAAATKAADERGLTNATFVQDDITSFGGYDGRFNTVVDSTLFNSLPVDGRDGYLRADTGRPHRERPSTCWCSPTARSRRGLRSEHRQ